ncbi:class I SAM-dependent methyltransferase [Mesorhizobium kowhaii]|nr:class I SAM-dependent methyltransferase [Mesorhizobium kowhaii]
MKILAPPQDDIHLANIMRQLDIGDELFWVPERLVQFEHWVGHIPFAFWLVKTLRPRRIVELGTHRGNSYCAFCQAIATLQLNAQAFAVDTWKGDIHMDAEVGVLEDFQAYHNPRFGGFSTLLQMNFDEAREMIDNRSIDLLHIDGTHTYEAVKHDFENWKSALSSRSVVLFHDTCVHRDKYGVWRLWNELSAKHPSFEFRHSFGLGVLGVGEDLPLTLHNLFSMSEDDSVAPTVRALFAFSGEAHVRTLAVSRLERDLKAERDDAAHREAALQTLVEAERDRLERDLKAERDDAAHREAALQTLVEAERDRLERDLKAERDDAAHREAALQTLVEAERDRLERDLKAERDDAAHREAALQTLVEAERDRLERDLKAERDDAAHREAALQTLVEAERDAAYRSAQVAQESTAQNRQLSEELANLQTQLRAFTTSTVWRATWPIRRVAAAIPAPIRRFGRRALKFGWWVVTLQLPKKLAERRERMLATAEALPQPLVGRRTSTNQARRCPPDLAKLISACFDEAWYDYKYALTARKLRGLDHYCTIGAKAGYSPNAAFDEEFYLSANPDVAKAVQAGGVLCGFDHYIRYGRAEGRSGQGRLPHDYSHLQPMFDEDWYDRTYELKDRELHGFAHYLAKGGRSSCSPHADFDEQFYSAFYPDVRLAISSRKYLCGFEHYVLVGRAENRLTKHNLTKTLDVRHPSLTDPVGIAQARFIERRIAPIAACSGADEESYWILVPTLDPDIFFGGYKALIELVVGLASLKRPITIVICAQDDDGSYFRYWITRQIRIAVAFGTVRIVNGRRLKAPLRLSPTDKIFAYSAWEAHLAHQMAAHVKSGLFAWLVQEYEPVFHDYSAEHAIVASAYQLAHYPIFNSTELKDYFQRHRIGIFSGDRTPSRGRDFAVFEHVLTKLRAPTLADLKGRPSRTLIFYARPEAHAKRNLFPLALIALEEMAQQGSFVGPWEFHGVGALAEMTIPLGRGHKLNLHAKMTEAEYEVFMHKVDVGLSLMYAPHPGLVAFEMASIGARVVTNTVDGRSETHLRGLSENIIPCEPTISGIKQALTEAIESLHDFSGRVRGMRINRSQGVKSWSEVFNDEFFHCEMDGFLGTDQQIVSEKTS